MSWVTFSLNLTRFNESLYSASHTDSTRVVSRNKIYVNIIYQSRTYFLWTDICDGVVDICKIWFQINSPRPFTKKTVFQGETENGSEKVLSVITILYILNMYCFMLPSLSCRCQQFEAFLSPPPPKKQNHSQGQAVKIFIFFPRLCCMQGWYSSFWYFCAMPWCGLYSWDLCRSATLPLKPP